MGCPFRVKLRSPGVQPAGRFYPQLRTWPCTAKTDALCQMGTSRRTRDFPIAPFSAKWHRSRIVIGVGNQMAEQQIRFDDGASYEQMMGIWSRPAGGVFLDC